MRPKVGRPAVARRDLVRRVAVVAVLGVLVVAACSGPDDASSSSTVAESAETTTSSVPTSQPRQVESTTTSSAAPVPSSTTTTAPTASTEAIRLNELQVIGSHNSYHLAPEGELKAGLEALVPALSTALDYTHRSLTEQLDEFGIRQFEIDVYADPEGGHYSRRVGLEVVGQPAETGIAELDEPGFKVLHMQDIDFRSTCLTLVACLSEIEVWSTANPTHVPVHVMIEIKTDTIEQIAAKSGVEPLDLGVVWTVPIATTAELLMDLEGEVLSVFDRSRIIVPDEVRGEFDALPAAISAVGWPTLDESRGKVMLSLNNRDGTDDLYRAGAPALEGRLLFTHADPGAPDAAIVRYDDPIADAELIAEALADGYIVRTRSEESTTPDGDTSRRDAALASGAQYVSTDVYEDVGRGFVVRLPGDAVVRCSPITASALCVDADVAE